MTMVRPIVIVEGPDGAGKTTLANTLCRRLGVGYRHEGPPPEGVDAFAHYGSLLFDAWKDGGGVFDRFSHGEAVYGPILRGVDRVGADGHLAIRGVLKRLGAVTVFCLPSLDTCFASWSARLAKGGEHVTSLARFVSTHAAFGDLARAYPLGGNDKSVVYDRDSGVGAEAIASVVAVELES